MKISEQLSSALLQCLAVFVISVAAFVVYRFKNRKSTERQTLLQYLGLLPARQQLDRVFAWIFIAIIGFGIVSTYLQYEYSAVMRTLLMSDSSPTGKILKSGLNFSALISAFIYCFIQSSASEELLFRGLIAKRIFHSFGFMTANIIQAMIFWLMHLLIFRLITGEWVNLPQAIAFVLSFGLGLVFGYVNARRPGQSILPSWILHGVVNFTSFLTLTVISS